MKISLRHHFLLQNISLYQNPNKYNERFINLSAEWLKLVCLVLGFYFVIVELWMYETNIYINWM